MKPQEIQKIHKRLAISLPQHHVNFLLAFEGFGKYNEIDISNFLYADADVTVKMNQRFGFYRGDKVITNKFIIGDNGGGDLYLIDLNNPADERVFVFDHEEFSGQLNLESLKYYDTIAAYRKSLEELFGLS